MIRSLADVPLEGPSRAGKLRASRSRRAVLAAAAVVAALALPSQASAAGLDLTVVTWDILGIKSNNTGLSTGPGPGFPVGVKVCNTSGAARTNVQTAFAFSSTNADITLSSPATDPVGDLAIGACSYSYFSVDVNRVAGARGTNRSYAITATSTEGSTGTTGTRAVYVQNLIAQNRNTTQKISGPGGCNADFTVCDPPPTSLVVGNTYTYKLYAETSTGYEQVEAFMAIPGSVFRTEEVSATYQTPAGATAPTPYADACGWTMNGALADFGSCTGPIVAPWAPGGKAGNRMVVTYTLKVIGTGSGSMTPLIYDFSGGSFHYNQDYGSSSFAVNYSAAVAYPLSTTVTGQGNVTSSPSGINCGFLGASCAKDYGQNQVVTLTATPATGQTFTSGTCPGSTWTAGAGGTYTCQVTMDAAKSATAAFSGTTYFPLAVQTSGAGSVVSVSTPSQAGQIQCSLTTSTCAVSYPDAALVTLFATPDSGNSFDPASSVCPGSGWTLNSGIGAYTCDVTMNAAKNASAVFNAVLPTVYGLTTSVTAGNGTISSSPAGINCDEAEAVDCSESYNSGTTVTLTATPKAGYRFLSWGGDCVSSTVATCTLSMSASKNATAQFEPIPTYPLDVTVSGGGKVTGSGIDCGSDCSRSYDDGTVVTLTVTPEPGKQFKGWGGACASAGTNLTCQVTMSQARSVTAQFEDIPAGTFPLSISRTGTGTVTGPGIDCGATCLKDYPPGEKVTLTAKPGSGYQLDPKASTCPGEGWKAVGDGSYTCEVTMDQAHEAKVVFTQIPSTFVIRSTSVDGGTADTKVRVPGPGTLTQTARRRAGGRNVTACRTVTRKPAKAGTVTLKCRETAATRAARRKGPVVVRLCTTYKPTGGTASTKCRRVVLASTKPSFTG